MRVIIALLSSITISFSSTSIQEARAIGIFDEKGNGENIQHTRKTKADYNGTCFSKIVVFGKYFHTTPTVYIGNSKGYLKKEESIYNKNKIKIGKVLTYKHFNVTKGYIKVTIDDKLYDYRVYIK